MCRSSFRIKIDLRNFYNDVRRFCWTFVEGTKMLKVLHLKMHITKMFNIEEPFHLLLNDTEYLPPNEDIRILRENETILVCVGSGLEDTREMFANTTVLSEFQNSFLISEKPSNSVQNNFPNANTNRIPVTSKPTSTPIKQISQNILVQKNLKDKAKLPNESLNLQHNDTLDSSTCDDNLSESEIRNTSLTRNNSTTNDSEVRPKRKRVRTRKRNKNQEAKQTVQEKDNNSKRPKIISSCIIPRGKHIHFDKDVNIEDVKQTLGEKEKTNGACTNPVPPAELANLLLLGQHSQPATFANTIVKEEIKVVEVPDEKLQTNNPAHNIPMELSKKFQEGKELLTKDVIECLVMTRKPQLKDIIAFKILKMGADYTPQVSELIVAEVMSCCGKEQMYTFRVIQGMSEMDEPIGKFALESDEDQIPKDTINMDFAQLIEPRLVYTDTHL